MELEGIDVGVSRYCFGPRVINHRYLRTIRIIRYPPEPDEAGAACDLRGSSVRHQTRRPLEKKVAVELLG
jgi:hypothetical protein